MFIAIPDDTVVRELLHDASRAAAFVQEISTSAEKDVSYLLHVRDKRDHFDTQTSEWNEIEVEFGRACLCWWALRTHSAAESVGIALTRKKEPTRDDSEMEILIVGDKIHTTTVTTDTNSFVANVNEGDVQIVQATRTEDFHGMSTTAPLTGHLAKSLNISPLDVLNEDERCRWFESEEILLSVLHHVDFNQKVNVIGMDLYDAAIVAMALVLAGHPDVHLCSCELNLELLEQLPSYATSEMFVPSTVELSNEDGVFNLSEANATVDEAAREAILKEYKTANEESVESKDEENRIDPQEYQSDFFTMPSPLPKQKFLDISKVIHQYSSLVLAPFGVLSMNPNPNIAKSTMLESKLKQGPVLQEIVETISDLIYDDFQVNESTMAMSSQKWLGEVRDRDCSARMAEINGLPQTLMHPPSIVELGTRDPESTLSLIQAIHDSIQNALEEKLPWALETQPEPDFTKTPLSQSSMTWYPSVVYQLGYKFNKSHKSTKQSSLQVKAKVQAIFQAIRSAVDEPLDAVQLQALIDSRPEEERNQVEKMLQDTFTSHHIAHDDVLVDNEMTDEAHDMFMMRLRDGDSCMRRQEVDVAIRRYTEAMNCVPLYHPILVDALTKRAKCYFKLKKIELAAADCSLALELTPFCTEAYAIKGDIAEANRDYEEALQNHVLAFILGGSRVVEQAEVIERISKHVGREKAKSIWATMIMRHDLPSKWLIDSYFHSFSRDADAGISLRGLSKNLVDSPAEGFEQYFLQAIDHKRSQQYQEAQREFAALAKFILDTNTEEIEVSKRVVALNLHATFLYITGDVEAALDVIKKALELDSTHLNSMIKKAGFLCELGDFDEADVAFEEAVLLDENNSDVYLHRGQMELIMGEYSAAVGTLRRSLTRCESLPVTHISYGMALYKAGSHYQSLDVFKTALEQFPDSHEVRLFYGDVLSDRADYGQAMMHLKKAFEFSSECPLPWLNAGRIFVATNDGNHAISHFEEALRVDPKCSAAHLDLAQVYFAQGKVEKAFEHFDAATQTCRFLPEVEDACACRAVATMQLQATTLLGVELRHMLKTKK